MTIGKDDPTHRLTGDIEEENQSRTNTKKFTSKTIQEKLKLRIDRAHGVSKNTSPEWPTAKYILEKIIGD